MESIKDCVSNYDQWMLERLLECQENKRPAVIHMDNQNEMFVHPGEGLVVKRKATFRSEEPELFRYVGTTPAELDELRAHGRPLQEILWFHAFHASAGELIHGCKREDVVKLVAMPDLSRVPHTEHSEAIARLLMKRPTSIVLASHILHIDEREVHQFYCAAAVAGYAVKVNHQHQSRS